jgi:hypothetical protein
MKETSCQEYAVIKAQIKELKIREEKLKVEIVKDLIASGEETVDLPVGRFTVARLKTWDYTPKVKELEEAFKAQKASEQSTGDATYTEKASLRFSEVKF